MSDTELPKCSFPWPGLGLAQEKNRRIRNDVVYIVSELEDEWYETVRFRTVGRILYNSAVKEEISTAKRPLVNRCVAIV